MSGVSDETRKTLVLTGASRGIGHATVKTFSAAGWRVITCSRHDFPEECPWASGPENHINLDLASEKSVEMGISKMKELLGQSALNALVNNAAISPKSAKGRRLGFVETELALWHQVFQVNFFAPLLLAKGLLEHLAMAQGSIINVTSIAGTRVHQFAGPAYATSKAALAALTREMSADLGPKGIRVNAIAPGEIDTAILSPGTEKLVEEIPLRRLGTPEEVAALIYFLCSSKAEYMTGAEIHINGGEHV
ncbi:SDR family NAD(P)-dependent oxidoreductase [Endozoicomonas atrinae]|uniref:SDR family NAD(P)-dependent oxidoreductase n=1 Tax=Endozoicomonas atrinae TaxID=1333660 RepID=UPI003AFFD028